MKIVKFLFAMFVSFLPGFIGLMFAPTRSGQDLWYASLAHSSLTPDGYVFSIVWTLLYFLLGVALFLIMEKTHKTNLQDKSTAYSLFSINALFNVVWTFSFFAAQSPQFAIIVLTALIVTALFMVRAFYRISKPAFWLTVPYVLWLFFAFYLNAVIIYLNYI